MKFDFFLLKDVCWMHDNTWTLFLFIYSEESIYKYMKFDFFLRMHVKMHEICLNMNFWFYSFWKMHIRMHEIWFSFLLHEIFNWIWKCMFECIKLDFFEWCVKFLIEFESLVWTKMYVWKHKILFFVLFEECIYECMKLCGFFWMKMHVWVHEICLNMNFWFFFFLKKCI